MAAHPVCIPSYPSRAFPKIEGLFFVYKKKKEVMTDFYTFECQSDVIISTLVLLFII